MTLNKERSAEEYKTVLKSVYEDMIELSDVSSKIMQLSKINADGSIHDLSPSELTRFCFRQRPLFKSFTLSKRYRS